MFIYNCTQMFGLELPSIPTARRTSKYLESQKMPPSQTAKFASIQCDHISVFCFLHPFLVDLKRPEKKHRCREANPSESQISASCLFQRQLLAKKVSDTALPKPHLQTFKCLEDDRCGMAEFWSRWMYAIQMFEAHRTWGSFFWSSCFSLCHLSCHRWTLDA